MSEESWRGIPRSKIPWGPKIDYEKCVNCGKCMDYCKLGVYEFEEKEGAKRKAFSFYLLPFGTNIPAIAPTERRAIFSKPKPMAKREITTSP